MWCWGSKKLISLLEGSICQKNASLESLPTVLKNNPGVISKFTGLKNERAVEGSLSQRDASLESLATVFKNNPEAVSNLVGPESGMLSSIIELTRDRYPQTRLLACMYLIVIRMLLLIICKWPFHCCQFATSNILLVTQVLNQVIDAHLCLRLADRMSFRTCVQVASRMKCLYRAHWFLVGKPYIW